MIDVPLAATSRGKLFAKIDGRECFETSPYPDSLWGYYLLFIIQLAAALAFSAVGITGIKAKLVPGLL